MKCRFRSLCRSGPARLRSIPSVAKTAIGLYCPVNFTQCDIAPSGTETFLFCFRTIGRFAKIVGVEGREFTKPYRRGHRERSLESLHVEGNVLLRGSRGLCQRFQFLLHVLPIGNVTLENGGLKSDGSSAL